MRDSYQQFFSKGFISKEQFFEFGLQETIYIPLDKAELEWEKLKTRIKNNEETYIRGFGRDASGTHLFQELYKNILGNENIKKDPTNNNKPTKLIRELTGYSKSVTSKNSKYKLIRNYQVSHVFGRTKNVYAFTAPWNIVYLPKILDPFTGHEAKGEMIEEFTTLFQQQCYGAFSALIEDFNQTITSPELTEKLTQYIYKLENNSDLEAKIFKKLRNAIETEFEPIIL